MPSLLMKNLVKILLQKFFGYHNYLFAFSIYSIRNVMANKYEEDFLFFLNMLPDNGAILDIGANIGITTVPLASKLKNTHVYAFEPMPDNCKTLRRIINFYKLKNVTVLETALGEKPGELKMVLPVMNKSKMQGLSHVVAEGDDTEWNKGVYFNVPVKKLDNMPELQNLPKITAIKIDVENFEYYVLKGGINLLAKHKPVIYCELWDNDKRTLVMEMLNGLSYKTMIFDGKGLQPFTNQAVENFIFI